MFYVGHELTENSRAGLLNGVADIIFDQVPEAQARRAIDLTMAKIGLTDDTVENPPIRFITFTSESI